MYQIQAKFSQLIRRIFDDMAIEFINVDLTDHLGSL